MFSLILRSKISENSVRSKLSFAAVGGGILFTQPHYWAAVQWSDGHNFLFFSIQQVVHFLGKLIGHFLDFLFFAFPEIF